MMPIEEGIEAYNRGDGQEMNPYAQDDGQYDEWEEGWLSAWACEMEAAEDID